METYVVLHELVHLRHRQHDREYWQALGRVMPDYERRREDSHATGNQPDVVDVSNEPLEAATQSEQ